MCKALLAIHALMGCDTTSAFFNHGKGDALDLNRSDDKFLDCLHKITSPAAAPADEELHAAGRHLVCRLYETCAECRPGDADLDALRLFLLKKKDVTKGELVDFRTIPPANAAVDQHIRRVHLQIHDWLGTHDGDDAFRPESCGWELRDHPCHEPGDGNPKACFPKRTVLPTMPLELLDIIKHGCAKDKCQKDHHCKCKKANQPCSDLCNNCKGITCNNPAPAPVSTAESTVTTVPAPTSPPSPPTAKYTHGQDLHGGSWKVWRCYERDVWFFENAETNFVQWDIPPPPQSAALSPH